jgi:hypothetical protein
MSSRRFRPVGSALVLAVLLALAAPPAQASGGSTLLDNLGAKVQIWLAGWLPGVRIDSVGTTGSSGRAALGGSGSQATGGASGRIESGTGWRSTLESGLSADLLLIQRDALQGGQSTDASRLSVDLPLTQKDAIPKPSIRERGGAPPARLFGPTLSSMRNRWHNGVSERKNR